MNQLLEQLYAQAFTDEQGEQFDPEKFARLIIDQCAEQYHATRPVDISFKQALLQHFGVEP